MIDFFLLPSLGSDDAGAVVVVDAVVVEVGGGSVEASLRDHRTVRDARRYLCVGEEEEERRRVVQVT